MKFSMESRKALVQLDRLTDAEIANAIRANGMEETNSDDSGSEEIEIDELTDSEDDPDFELSDGSDIEQETDEDSENETIDPRSTVFKGRDNTEWHPVPFAQPSRLRDLPIVKHKVILPPGKHLDTILDCF